MKFVDQPGINLNAVQVRSADIPTMSAGTYEGLFVGATKDGDGNPWVSVTTTKQSHTEQSDIDVSGLQPGQAVRFTIAMNGGAVAYLVGSRYKLVDKNGNQLAEPMPAEELYQFVKDNNIGLAQFSLVDIQGA